MKIPNIILVSFWRMKFCSNRGLNCCDAIDNTTIVIENEILIIVITAPAIASKINLAVSGVATICKKNVYLENKSEAGIVYSKML